MDRFEPTRGAEIRKMRPALIVSNDIANEHSNLVMVAPLTSNVKRVYSFEVKTIIADKQAKAAVNQCRAVDKQRLTGKIGTVDLATMQDVEKAIKLVFGLSDS